MPAYPSDTSHRQHRRGGLEVEHTLMDNDFDESLYLQSGGKYLIAGGYVMVLDSPGESRLSLCMLNWTSQLRG